MVSIIPGSVGGTLNGIMLPIRTVNSDTTLLDSDFTVEVNASSGNVIITLPTAASQFNATLSIGRLFNIKKIDPSANLVTIQPQGTDKIDQLLNLIISAQDVSYSLQSDGTRYIRL